MALHRMPIIGKIAVTMRRTLLDRVSWMREKRAILGEVRGDFDAERSLDVSRRYGHHLFHDKGNSLIRRGELYEPEITGCLSFLFNLDALRENETRFADIGANIGLHTFFTIQHFPGIKIAAFDPSPSSWKYLELSLAYNKVENVTLHTMALSDATGQSEFYTWGDESSADSMKNTGRVPGIEPKILTVKKQKLDDLPNAFTVYKLDCEGSELAILHGSKESMAKNKPFIVCEFNPINIQAFSVTPADIFSFLSSVDYSLFSLDYRKLTMNDFMKLQEKSEENYVLLPNGLLNA